MMNVKEWLKQNKRTVYDVIRDLNQLIMDHGIDLNGKERFIFVINLGDFKLMKNEGYNMYMGKTISIAMDEYASPKILFRTQ